MFVRLKHYHEMSTSVASGSLRAPNMWVCFTRQTFKCRSVWFVYVGAPPFLLASDLETLHTAEWYFHVSYHPPPPMLHRLTLNCYAGWCIRHMPTRSQVPPLHPHPALTGITNLRSSKDCVSTGVHACACTSLSWSMMSVVWGKLHFYKPFLGIRYVGPISLCHSLTYFLPLHQFESVFGGFWG